MEKLLIIIDNEVVEIEKINNNGFDGFLIECNNGCDYHMFENHDVAGKAARYYWQDMAENDKSEFVCIVGEDALVNWCIGEYTGPGSTKVKSLNEWLDLWLDIPAEQWASYDGEEIEGVRFNKHVAELTGFIDKDNVVLYRCN